MNIAFEISPLLSASGSFGDKSGVYRYTYGLISGYLKYLESRNSKSKVILFTFNPTLLVMPQNPGISNLAEHKNVIFISDRDWNNNKHIIYRLMNYLYGIEQHVIYDILPFKLILIFLIRVVKVKTFILRILEKNLFQYYCQYLDQHFKKHKIKAISHSDTAFFKMKGYKNIITIYDLTALNMPEFHREATRDIQNRKVKFAKNEADGILSISKSTRRDLFKRSARFKKKAIKICYPGVDDIFFENTTSTHYARDIHELFREKFDIDLNTKRFILYYGTYEPRKNIPHAVKAFCELEKEDRIPSDFIFILCGGKGWGRIKTSIDNFITENYPLRKKRKIITFNFLNDEYLKVLIRKAYAVVYPSLYEGFGLPVIESMSQGTPVITTHLSSLPEAGGDAAFYIDPYDYTDFKQKMETLLNDQGLRNTLAKKSITQAKKFDWTVSAKEFYNFVRRL